MNASLEAPQLTSPLTPTSPPHFLKKNISQVHKSSIPTDATRGTDSLFHADHNLLLAFQQQMSAIANEQAWDKTIERVVKGVVSIKAATVRSFDTECSGDYTATGFVVDKKRGIILSNRHVVNPAPIIATAVFVNYEEVPLQPIYRDPVHDFGFFKFDPDKIKFLDVEEIELRPDLAKVGLSIKVVGNDSGEKLSILGSTLARLDRGAPKYGDDVYEDFNTFYYQAATGTSGGSSGSPVLNIAGQAIALNAGGSKRSASSFYLPLDRIVRALKCLQAGFPITRGTIQTEFIHRSYDELRRLGLQSEVETMCRARRPSSTGLLTVAKVLPDGPACGQLEPGDILIASDDKHIDNFVDFWDILDDSINRPIKLTLYRGQMPFFVTLTIQDLHSITPSRFLEVGGGIFHDLSYQQARSYGMSLKNAGTFVALSGMFDWTAISRNFLITSIANKPTPNLEEFIDVIKSIPDGKRVPIRSRDLGQSRESTDLVQIDRHFHLDHLFIRNDVKGIWDCFPLGAAEDSKVSKVQSESSESMEVSDVSNAVIDDAADVEEEEDQLQKSLTVIKDSLVYVTARLPFSVYGWTSCRPYYGIGTLLSLDPPIVACDRAAVPCEVVDILLTIQHHTVSARVVAMGKVAYLTFDLESLPSHVKLSVPEFNNDADIKIKDDVVIVGLNNSHAIVEKPTKVNALSDVSTAKCNPPRARLVNVEGISVVDTVTCDGGVLAQKFGEGSQERYHIAALWINASSQNSGGNDTFWKTGLHYGVYVKPLLDNIISNFKGGKLISEIKSTNTRTFNFECGEMSLSTATGHGLSSCRVRQFTKLAKKRMNSSNAKVVSVFEKFPHYDKETNDQNDIKSGDIILEIEGQPIVRHLDLEKHLQNSERDSFEFCILRSNQEKRVIIKPLPLVGPQENMRVVQWNGAFLHETFSEAIEEVTYNSKLVPLRRGVYVGSVSYGAPALNNIRPAQWIVEVNDEKVDNIDHFIEIVQRRRWKDGDFIRVKQVSRKDVTSVVSVQVNEQYWPTRRLERTSSGTWEHSLV
ncbi:hypothetical protein V1511DRAFT_493318 [Dipodascopsis uninucleata]